MAEDRRRRDDNDRSRGRGGQDRGRPSEGRGRSDRPARGDGSDRREGRPGRSDRPARDGRTDRPGRDGAPSRGRSSDRRDDRPNRGDRQDDRGRGRRTESSDRGGRSDRPWSRDGGDRRTRRDDVERTADQAKYDGPPLPEEITGRELDRNVMGQLKSLPEKLALRVARHLVAAGQLLEEDPKTAYQHTLAARARASRLAIVREAVGEAAYAAGEFAEALTELKAARRMNGSAEYLAVMADCERALKRPDKALALIRNAPENLDDALQIELRIVEAGARRDRGEFDAALRILENQRLNSRTREAWVVRLRYAYADTLLAAGRREDALEWFHRTEAIDGDIITDAAERVRSLERQGSTED